MANSSKRYRYYRLICQRCKGSAAVVFPLFPTLALLLGIFKKPPFDEALLLDAHLQRQANNYPKLTKYPLLWRIYCRFAQLTERARLGHYFYLFNRLDCEAVAIWNGQRQPYLTMVKAAQMANKRVLYFENGLLPDTSTADYRGVNAFNSVPRDPGFYLNLPQTATTNLPETLVTREPHRKRLASGQKLDSLPKHYYFIPFQVPTDSQVMVQSPWVHSMEQLFELLLSAHTKLAAQWHSQEPLPYLVFKEHPSWPGHFTQLYQQNPYCLFANENNTQDLIENAQAVITINSTVGLESLLLGKKVITLGNACYNIGGLVLHAENETGLFEVLKGLPQWQFDDTLRLNFLRFIQQSYCIPHDWQKMLTQPDEAHFDAILARIFERDDLAGAIGDE